MTGQDTQSLRPAPSVEAGWSSATLEELWQKGFPGFTARAKFRLVEMLASCVRTEHDQRRSLARTGLSAVEVRWSAAPGACRVELRGSASVLAPWGDFRLRDLARLYSAYLPAVNRSIGLRFMRAYFKGSESLRDCLAFAVNIDNLGRQKAAARWKRAERDCLQTGSGFLAGRSGPLRFFRRDSAEAEALLAKLLVDPEGLMQGGTRLPGRGNNCITVKIEVGGRNYVLKRYNRRGWGYSFRHVFRRSRALRGWITSWGFRARGVPVPDPILCMEERPFRFLGHSYILSEYLNDTMTLTRWWPSLSRKEKKNTLARLAVLFGRLHRLGAIHGDTNWDNILVESSCGRNKFFLIDMDCSRVYRRPRERRVRKDIQHVFRDLHRLEPGEDELDRLFRTCWSRWAGVGQEN